MPADTSEVTLPGGRLATLVGGLHDAAFRKLWLSQVVSEVGDWAARLALTTVVYQRTGSAAWAALISISGLLPMLGPGQLLATFADHVDRRLILVGADGMRAVVFLVMALTTPPTLMLLVMSVAAGVATVPFEAARSAAMLDVTTPERLPAAISLGQATQSLALVVGWGVGGVLLVAIGSHGAFAVNAATFLLSAAFLVRLPALRSHAVADSGSAEVQGTSALRRLAAAAAAVTGEPLVRRAAIVAVLAVGPATAVEGLVVPFVEQTWSQRPSLSAALLAGGALLDLLLTVLIPTTLPPEQLLRVAAWCSMAPAAVAAVLFSTGRPVLVSIGFVVSAMSLTAIAPASAALAPRLPAALRASCFTVLATALTLTQVLLTTGGGAVADAIHPAQAARLLLLFPLAAGAAALLRPMPEPLSRLEPVG